MPTNSPTSLSLSADAAGQAHVLVRNLGLRHAGMPQPAIDDISFALPKGKMLALLGPSGCGKTTMLRMIAGLLAPDSGSIWVNGRDMAQVPVHERQMGMVFQSYALFPHMSVADNVAFGLAMRGMPKAARPARVAWALELVKLTGFGDRRIGQLSGGQQQRVAIARALVIEPQLLLLDEPLSNLDAKLREEMREEIRQIQAHTGVTTIFVTHDQDEALSMADQVAVLSSGRLEQIGTPQEIFEAPRSDFVAAFIGAGNFLAGRVSAPGVASVAGFGELRFTAAAQVGAPVRLLLRPHRLRLLSEEQPAANRFTGTIEHTVYRGQIQTLLVRVGEQSLQLDLPTHAGTCHRQGDVVVVGVEPADVTVIGGGG